MFCDCPDLLLSHPEMPIIRTIAANAATADKNQLACLRFIRTLFTCDQCRNVGHPGRCERNITNQIYPSNPCQDWLPKWSIFKIKKAQIPQLKAKAITATTNWFILRDDPSAIIHDTNPPKREVNKITPTTVPMTFRISVSYKLLNAQILNT